MMQISFVDIIEFIGTFAFAISGIRLASAKQFDLFGAYVVGLVTAIGGENSVGGEARFERDVLSLRPDVLTVDYSLNDRAVGLESAEKAWCSMIEKALEYGTKVILCTPTWDNSYYKQNEKWEALVRHAEQVRMLADRYDLGLADSFKAFEKHISEPSDLAKYLSHVNHPTEAGHALVADEIAKYFIAR